jgi:hypothetical protein
VARFTLFRGDPYKLVEATIKVVRLTLFRSDPYKLRQDDSECHKMSVAIQTARDGSPRPASGLKVSTQFASSSS